MTLGCASAPFVGTASTVLVGVEPAMLLGAVTVDPEILEAAHESVTAGRAESLSAWVNRALTELVARERRLAAMADAIARYEAEFGVITEEEMARQTREDRGSARVIRGSSAARTGRRRRGAA